YALARLWISWGVRPQAMIGHSIGEYVAACLANVFSLEDALTLVAMRGRLIQSVAGGSMLSVVLAEDEVRPLLSEELTVAAVNGPTNCVIAGPTAEIARLELLLQSKKIAHRRLHVSHAFHSAMMDPILESFTEQIQAIKLTAPEIRYVSDLTGTWVTDAEATSPAYWTAHLRHTVRFADGLSELLKEPARIFLEVGPGTTLNQLLRQQKSWTNDRVALASLRSAQDNKPDEMLLQRTLGRLWLAGARIDWTGFYVAEKRRRLPLPGYAFERQRYWVEPKRRNQKSGRSDFQLSVEPDASNGSHGVEEVQITSEPIPTLHARPDLPTGYRLPSNEVERKLAKIWERLLGIEPVGV